ncbi:DEHA2E19008p [Debaryomyces hansenii CBS767]|uniref:DEHA2E19008p n=1 Tax=Debaryomyces hansenii (strain ATCC 36239 / CBS 767 / BCRC 21394 / JCM 1990 / NBRC 0083 / IGC 2968) TaxID=284592 RepID=Q6BNU2_DEBHA|nr:mitochondrial 54S ribosomal protein YmL36 [Debaryomyces hansenii CBS767]CAG88398.1 DEHA2E19008p [Debaryomyces hansenii CBS767]|eukprot:XP_460128.1 mitochondrial 54S ribosomal protein YmL36 [Debaryomyces hansenii CBS767]
MFNRSNIKNGLAPVSRSFQRNVAMKGDVHLSNRRVMRKIKLGKARPAIFHQFETLVELSDGSVIKRRSQAPKDEIRMINDQRNSTLWNPHRSDLASINPNATGKVNRFKQRFSSFEQKDDQEVADVEMENAADSENIQTKSKHDDYIELMGHNVEEVKGGKLLDKKSNKKKK